jgi:hypothetical protein
MNPLFTQSTEQHLIWNIANQGRDRLPAATLRMARTDTLWQGALMPGGVAWGRLLLTSPLTLNLEVQDAAGLRGEVRRQVRPGDGVLSLRRSTGTCVAVECGGIQVFATPAPDRLPYGSALSDDLVRGAFHSSEVERVLVIRTPLQQWPIVTWSALQRDPAMILEAPAELDHLAAELDAAGEQGPRGDAPPRWAGTVLFHLHDGCIGYFHFRLSADWLELRPPSMSHEPGVRSIRIAPTVTTLARACGEGD